MSHLRKIVYVSPKFPALSLVFEQNEMLGIQSNKIDILIASCRNSLGNETHEFVKPLLDKVIYPNYKNVLLGIILCIKKSPVSLLKILTYALIGSANPFFLKKNIAALILVLGWYPVFFKEKKDYDYDWIHADFSQGTATVALMLSELLKSPFSFKVHAFDIYNKSLKSLDLLKNIKINQARLIFSEHEYGKKELLKFSPNSDKKIIINYTAIRPNDFRELPPVLNSNRFVALGRLVSKKGFDILIRASGKLSALGENFVVDIYGDGSEEKKLRNLIKEHNLQEIVHLKGKYKNEDMPKMLTNCVALVMPCIIDRNGDMDGIPTVLYEAMALGRAVISSKISGIPEIIQEGVNGYLCEAGNVEELAEAMHSLLSNKHLSFEMGAKGRQLVESNHDYITNAKSLLERMNSYL